MKIDFAHFNTIAQSFIAMDDIVIWVCDPMYERQIYLSSSYEFIWEQSCTEIYQDRGSWISSLVDPDEKSIKQLYSRLPNSKETNIAHYVIHTQKTQQKKFIRDRCFYLYEGNDGPCVGIAGIAQELSERQWAEELAQHDLIFKHRVDDFHLRLKKLGLAASTTPREPNNALVELSKRQLECLYYILQGESLKQVALRFHRSPRTIESHIGSIKEKFNCRRIVDLFAKIPLNQIEELIKK